MLRITILAAVGGGAAVLVPRGIDSEPRIVVEWVVSLASGEQSSRRNMSPPLLERQRLLPVWQDSYLRYLDPRDGAIVSEQHYLDGVAFSTWLHTDAEGDGDILHSDGRFAYRVDNQGRLFFRKNQLFSVSRYAHSLRSFADNGRTRWEYAPGDVITAVLPVGVETLVGTAGGMLQLVEVDGKARGLRAGDGNPVVGLEQTDHWVWVVIGGGYPRVEQRPTRNPGNAVREIELPVNGPVTSTVAIQANFDSVVLPELGLRLQEDGQIYSQPQGVVLLQFADVPLQLEARMTDSRNYRELRITDRWGGHYVRDAGNEVSGILKLEHSLLLWSEDTAVFYRLDGGGA